MRKAHRDFWACELPGCWIRFALVYGQRRHRNNPSGPAQRDFAPAKRLSQKAFWPAADGSFEDRNFLCCNRSALRPYRRGFRHTTGRASGCSSGVEHNLAKVGVERSNRFTRSSFLREVKHRKAAVLRGFFVFGRLNHDRQRDLAQKIPPRCAPNGDEQVAERLAGPASIT